MINGLVVEYVLYTALYPIRLQSVENSYEKKARLKQTGISEYHNTIIYPTTGFANQSIYVRIEGLEPPFLLLTRQCPTLGRHPYLLAGVDLKSLGEAALNVCGLYTSNLLLMLHGVSFIFLAYFDANLCALHDIFS